ncbi:Six-hairpin glycosidase [Thozetella sp. PMI_491]|nr:Six-hairpin glycosidase [Thozetella sp. PMI_491]
MRTPGLAACVLATLAGPAAAAPTESLPYSVQMATSIMSRSQGIMTGTGGSSEPLMAGFAQKALTALVAQYPDSSFTASIAEYIRSSAASVAKFTLNATNDALVYPLDRLSNGNALYTFGVAEGANSTSNFSAAAVALRESIDLNRRNSEGGLWYFVYPQWSYLDGMYSLAPFMTLWATEAGAWNGTDTLGQLDQMLYQMELLWKHNRNETTGLLVHGYDDSLTAVWANPVTGASPYVWGRSLGWFTMTLVDTLELLPKGACKHSKRLLEMYQALALPLLDAVDPQTGGWWQIVDMGGREKNYIESSGSAMFAYSLLKGARLGYLTGDLAGRATSVGVRAQKYLTDTFLVQEGNGVLGYNGTVAVCSLNSTASYDYYTGQPLLYNSVHGSAAYILASLESERLQ